MPLARLVGWSLLALLLIAPAHAQEPTATVLLDGLREPNKLSVHSGSGDVFLSDAGGIACWKTDFGDEQSAERTTTSVIAAVEGEPITGLDYLSGHRLAIARGSAVSVYSLNDESTAAEIVGEAVSLGDDSPRPTDLIANGTAIYVACADDAGGSIRWASLRTPTLEFKTLAKLPEGVSPTAMTFSPRGELVIAAIDGESARLMFINSQTGKRLYDERLPLARVSDLAYSPKTGLLYALQPVDEAGLYRLDAALREGRPGIAAVKQQPVERPASMAFWPDGRLYVTTLGKSDARQPGGSLLRLLPASDNY